jgi:hypothetical protein
MPNDIIHAEVTENHWPHRATVVFLHEVVGVAFKRKFSDVLTFGSTPVFGVERQRSLKVLGSYRRHTEQGLEHWITMAPWLSSQHTLPLLVGVAIHELVHLQQHELGIQSASRYHNANFREVVSRVGLPCSEFGAFAGMTPVFTVALREVLSEVCDHALRISINLDVVTVSTQLDLIDSLQGDAARQMAVFEKAAPTSLNTTRKSLTPWSCGCQRVWSSTNKEFRALCTRCGGVFRTADQRGEHK